MNNWMKRFAVFAVLGAMLSSAMLVGCGGGGGEDAAAENKAPAEKKEGGDSE